MFIQNFVLASKDFFNTDPVIVKWLGLLESEVKYESDEEEPHHNGTMEEMRS